MVNWICPHVRRATAGVDGLIDAAVIGPPILPAVRDGGRLAAVRPFAGDSERGIEVLLVRVTEYLTNQAALARLARIMQ